MIKLFRKRKYKLKDLYICLIRGGGFEKAKIMFLKNGFFTDPFTGNILIHNQYISSMDEIYIDYVYGKLTYLYDLPNDIYRRGDYLTLDNIVEIEKDFYKKSFV